MQIQLDTSGMPNRLRLVIERPPPAIEIALGACPVAAKSPTTRRLSIDRIKDTVAGARGLTVKDQRNLEMFIASGITNYSLPQIAREFGKRGHTAVMYARDKVKHRMKSDDGHRNRVWPSSLPAKPRPTRQTCDN